MVLHLVLPRWFELGFRAERTAEQFSVFGNRLWSFSAGLDGDVALKDRQRQVDLDQSSGVLRCPLKYPSKLTLAER